MNMISTQANYQEKYTIEKKNRIYYYDYLRIFSSFAVVIIHVSASFYNTFIISSNNWKITFYYNGAFRFAVPIFFMISGDLFLKKDIFPKKLYLKYIKNLLIHYIFWSLIYSSLTNGFAEIIRNFIFFCFKGYFHLWYLLTTIGLYMIVPFLREIVKKDNLLKAFLSISFFFNFILPILFIFLDIYNKEKYELLKNINYNIKMNFLQGLVFYFVLGYYLNNIERINKYLRIISFLLGLLSFSFTTKLSYSISIKKQKKINFFSPLNLNILAYSISIWVFFKSYFNKPILNKNKIIKMISNATFGIYLIHPLIQKEIIKFINPKNKLIYKIPFISFTIFILSLIISINIKFIPILKKYLV